MPNARKPFMRCLGEFVGHIVQGVKADPMDAAGRRIEVGRETAEKEGTLPDGRRVIARRTIVDEVVVQPRERRQ